MTDAGGESDLRCSGKDRFCSFCAFEMKEEGEGSLQEGGRKPGGIGLPHS